MNNNLSNPFSGGSNANIDIYQRLTEMRNTPFQNYRTVFNDITDEWSNCSEDERKFIEQDKEYIDANVIYAQQFNAFLLDQLGLQFSNSKYGASAEKVLIALRNAKGRFRTTTAEDLAKIRDENALLQKQIKELEELINGCR